MAVELTIPRSGESITEVQIGEWRKREGDSVRQDEILVEIETDKASMDLPAPASGRLSRVLKKQGDMAQVGDVIAYIEEGAAESAPAAVPAAPAPVAAPTQQKPERQTGAADQKPRSAGLDVQAPQPSESSRRPPAPAARAPAAGGAVSEPRVMPAARRVMAQAGLMEDQVTPTGPGGRILKEDVQAAVAAGPSPAPPVSTDRRDEVVPMSMLRKRIAQRLVEAQQTAALLTTFNEVDMSAVIRMRQEYQKAFTDKHGIKLGFMSFFVKAAVSALQRFPELNAEIHEHSIVYHRYYDVGVAVSTEKGLVVPILRDADGMSFADIEKAIEDLARRARENKLKIEELQGGTFSISNGGIFGSLLSTPIVNPPQSGILGLHAIQERPVVRDGQIVIRSMMYIALTYDHRIVDGRGAVTFLRHIKEVVEDPARLLFEV